MVTFLCEPLLELTDEKADMLLPGAFICYVLFYITGVPCRRWEKVLCHLLWFMGLPLVTGCGSTLAFVTRGEEGRVRSRGGPIRERPWEKCKKKPHPAERQAFLLDDKCLEFSDSQNERSPWPRPPLPCRCLGRARGPPGRGAARTEGGGSLLFLSPGCNQCWGNRAGQLS